MARFHEGARFYGRNELELTPILVGSNPLKHIMNFALNELTSHYQVIFARQFLHSNPFHRELMPSVDWGTLYCEFEIEGINQLTQEITFVISFQTLSPNHKRNTSHHFKVLLKITPISEIREPVGFEERIQKYA